MWGVKTHPSMSVDLSQWQHHQNASLSQPAALAQARGFVEPSGPQAARPWSEELSRLSDFHQFHISQHNLSLCNSQSLIACLSLTPYYSLSLTNSGEVWKSCCQKECLLCEWKGHFFLLLPQSSQHYMRFCPYITLISGCSEIDTSWQSDPLTFVTLWPLLTGSMVEVTEWWEKSDQDELACQTDPSGCDHSIYYKVCMLFYFISTMISSPLFTASIGICLLRQHPNWNGTS